MAFNSYLFLLAFLPGAIGAYYAVALTGLHRLRLPLLILLTLLFYARAAARHLPLLIGSILFNYACARLIAGSQRKRRQLILIVGVSANVAALLYFKYTGFFVESINALTSRAMPIPHILLPLAISFYTFQQIAFLVDTSRDLIKPTHPLGYASSILFFPFVISGPITFYREVGPQLEWRPERHAVSSNILVGFSIFTFGLFKKTVIADSFALWADPLFNAAAGGHVLGVAGAWAAAIAYLLQIYYDFSGYSDMAIGTARMLGIVLPLNFHSPIRSTGIADFWRRWHITLGRFVNVYIFQVIALPLSRWAAQKGASRVGMLAAGTLLPTFLTMIVIGAWHGGNWTFVVFGILHGSYMVTQEAWRFATRRKRKGKVVTWPDRAGGNLLTMLAVILAFVMFRAPDVGTALHIWADMIGVDGWHSTAGWPVLAPLAGFGLLLAAVPAIALAYLMPNTQQFMSRMEPALEWPKWRQVSPAVVNMVWRPRVGWALSVGVIFALGFAFVSRGNTNFVYFGF